MSDLKHTFFSHMHVDISLTARLNGAFTENRLICNHHTNTQEISGFRRGAVEASALLGCYAAQVGSYRYVVAAMISSSESLLELTGP